MKLSDIVKQIDKGNSVPGELPAYYYQAVDDLIAWAKEANEALISLDALWGEKLSDEFAHQVGSLIDTEVQ